MPDTLPTHPLPRRVFVITTLSLDGTAPADALFRPCKLGAHWVADDSDGHRFSDRDPARAASLRAVGPRFQAAVREGKVRQAVLDHPGLLPATADFDGVPVSLKLRAADLRITDVGYGVLVLAYAVAPGKQGGAELIGLDFAKSVANQIGPLVTPFIKELHFSDGAALEGVTRQWVHVAYDFADAEHVALERLAPDAEKDGSQLQLTVDRGFVKPGLGGSVIAGASGDVVQRAVNLLALTSAYNAAAAEFDRLVMIKLRESMRKSHASYVDDTLFEEVSVFRTVLSVMYLHLEARTALEVRLWSRYMQAWRFDAQLAALNEKLTLLLAFQDRDASRLVVHRSWQLAVAASAFTVIGFVTTVLALIDFGQAKSLSAPDPTRTLLSVLLMVLLGAGFVFWLRRALRRQ